MDHRELIAAVSLLEPGPQVALVLVRGGLVRLPLVRDGEILLKVGEQVHDERVLLVKLVIAIQMGLMASTVMPMGNVLVALVILVPNALNAKVDILKNKVENAQKLFQKFL